MSQKVAANRGRVRAWSGAVVGLISLASLSSAAHAQASAVADFNYLNNTNTAGGGIGTWSYGEVLSLSSFNSGNYTLTAYPAARANDLGITGLDGRGPAASNLPTVAKNDTSSTISSGTVRVPTNHLELHPGSAGEVTVVRFTAGATGSYTFSGDFQAQDGSGTTSRGSVVRDGSTGSSSVLFSSAVTGNYGDPGTVFSFTGSFPTLTLSAGETIDFAVDYGSNGTFTNDSTGLLANVSFTASSAAPEPGALALLVPGMLGIVGFARRRKTA